MLVLQFCHNFYGSWCYLNKAITAAAELFEPRREMSFICTGILLVNTKREKRKVWFAFIFKEILFVGWRPIKARQCVNSWGLYSESVIFVCVEIIEAITPSVGQINIRLRPGSNVCRQPGAGSLYLEAHSHEAS